MRSESELREWIREGACGRLGDNPDGAQLDALVADIRWVAPELP